LYNALVLVISEIDTLHVTDMLALLKTINIALVQKRQYSNDLMTGFLKRLGLLALTSPPHFQSGILMMIKRIISKYPNTKGVVDFNYMGNETATHKEDEKILSNEDPQLLTNVHQISIYTPLISIAQSTCHKVIKDLVF